MEAAPARLKHATLSTFASMSFDPEQIYQEIKKHMPDFEMAYEIDPLKQAIADSWPDSLDDSCSTRGMGLDAAVRPGVHDRRHA